MKIDREKAKKAFNEYAEKYDDIGDDEDIVNRHLKNGYDPEDDDNYI